MKKLLVIALTTCILAAPCTAGAMLLENSTNHFRKSATAGGNKEARKARKAERKARRAEYSQRTNSVARKTERARIMKENYKQRRKMDREAKKENSRSWGRNQSGDVFGVY